LQSLLPAQATSKRQAAKRKPTPFQSSASEGGEAKGPKKKRKGTAAVVPAAALDDLRPESCEQVARLLELISGPDLASQVPLQA
jgi:hypothetical protein